MTKGISTTEAESLLISWGSYMRGNHNGLLVPAENVLHRIHREGAGASHSTARIEPYMPWYVEIVERCVLVKFPKSVRRVCKHTYIGGEPPAVIQRKLKLTRAEYDQRINQACHILADYLIEN